jgi:hypothetical protein
MKRSGEIMAVWICLLAWIPNTLFRLYRSYLRATVSQADLGEVSGLIRSLVSRTGWAALVVSVLAIGVAYVLRSRRLAAN